MELSDPGWDLPKRSTAGALVTLVGGTLVVFLLGSRTCMTVFVETIDGGRTERWSCYTLDTAFYLGLHALVVATGLVVGAATKRWHGGRTDA